MKHVSSVMLVALFGFVVFGCSQQPKAESSSEAIQQAMTLENAEAQAQYLVQQAKAFVRSEQYQEAIKSAQYVVTNLKVDAEIEKAKQIIEDAKARLEAQAKSAVGDAKSKLGL